MIILSLPDELTRRTPMDEERIADFRGQEISSMNFTPVIKWNSSKPMGVLKSVSDFTNSQKLELPEQNPSLLQCKFRVSNHSKPVERDSEMEDDVPLPLGSKTQME